MVEKCLDFHIRLLQGYAQKSVNLPFNCSYRLFTHLQQTPFENIVEIGEIVHVEQFLLFPQYFQYNFDIQAQFCHLMTYLSGFEIFACTEYWKKMERVN